jgi:L-ribulose-5-phosphate 3-epimerase
MNPITFMTANFVALPLGFRMRAWDQGSAATADLLRDPERYGERFDAMLGRIAELAFTDIDLWLDHLHPRWATPRHVETAVAALAARSMRVHSILGYFGETVEEIRALEPIARAVGCDLLSGGHGSLGKDTARLAAALRSAGLRLAYENHPEPSAQAMLERIGESDADVLGIAFDSGWAGSQGFDPVAALDALAPRLWHLHLKDVLPPRTEPSGYQLIDLRHETCALGEGIARSKAVLQRAIALGFTGPIGIEHEPETHDPTPELRTSLQRVREWLNP